MSRYPALPPSELSCSQKKVYDKTLATCKALFGPKFLYMDNKDAFVGPFAPLLYTPSLMEPYIQVAVELGKFEEISPAARETTILATGSVYKAEFELYAHSRLAEMRGLDQSHIQQIRQGIKPSDLSEDCNIAFDMAIALAHGKGPLDQDLFQRAVNVFGTVGTLAIIHYVGIYSYTCILLNAVAAPVPE